MKYSINNIIAAGMITAPAWGPFLEGFNQLLTTVSLLFGIVWIAIQMNNYFKNKKDNHDPK